MKTKSTGSQSFLAGKGLKNQNDTFADSLSRSCISFSGLLTSVLVLFILFVCINANAQIPPSANITGPLKAFANDSAIVITSDIGTEAEPSVNYTLLDNKSGAYIVSQGPLQYDGNTGQGKQTVLVNPGSSKGSFNISLVVTTAYGTCEASKSVTVVAH